MKSINIDSFKVKNAIKLSQIPTNQSFNYDKDNFEDALEDVSKKLSELQDKMYAHNRYSVLICLQGMDTSGKDSLIREVFKHFNARGVVVHSFKVPNSTELEHDYLWRHYLALPEKGKFAVFNRTHYENVLVTRVHPEYIMGENLPGVDKVADVDEAFWDKRFEQINNFEKHISQNGTVILKFFLHMSKDEQKKRLLKRLENPEDQWKFSTGDLKERALWDDYMQVYEDAINRTSTDCAPWHVIPADDKPMARFLVAQTILERLQLLTDIKEPTLDEKTLANLEIYKAELKK
jgi:PPK2 family polyphosphate:nucleotide phosphotransferase